MTLLSLNTLAHPIEATASTISAISAFVRRTLMRRRMSAKAAPVMKDSAIECDLDSAESGSPTVIGQLASMDFDDAVPACEAAPVDRILEPFSDDFDDVFELLPLDEQAIFDMLHCAGIRARIIEPEGRRTKVGQLITFTFRGCEITALPEYLFTEGGSIAILIVRDNKVKSIDSKICKLSNLRILDVSGNCLTDLPESMVALPHLSALDISRNPMQSIPKSVFGIQTLHVLYLSGLQLESLPEELSSLRHLRELHCNDNALTEIPPVVMRLPSLQLLNLSNNRISFVPSEVPLAMPQLRQLFLSGNPTGVSPWMQSCDSLHIVL